MNELALFAGAGGGILGGHLLGWRTVCAVEWEPYAACVLAARQNDKVLSPFPIWDDVQTFDGRPWRGIVDVVSGGFPCQDISAAGKGAGIDGERSGMWREMARVVSEVRPRFVFVENSPMLVTRGLERVLGDLTSLGYDTRWTVMGAADVGAPHQRDRIWIVGKMAHTNNNGLCSQEQRKLGKGTIQAKTREKSDKTWGHRMVAHSKCEGLEGLANCGQSEIPRARSDGALAYTENCGDVRRDWKLGVAEEEHNDRRSQTNGGGQWWQVEPDVGRVVDGVAARVDRLKAIGNGQVSEVARRAWEVLNEEN
jgi:DNA (cytosine-5)-methyltransferase 1